MDELSIDVRVHHAWDLPVVTLDLGVSIGGSVFRQTFDTPGTAKDRVSGAPHIAAGVGIAADAGRGFYPLIEVEAETYVYRFQAPDAAARWTPAAAVRFSAGLGKHW